MDNQFDNGLPRPAIGYGDNIPPAPPLPAAQVEMPATQLPKQRRMLQIGPNHYIDPQDVSAVFAERNSYLIVLLKSGHKLEVGQKQLHIPLNETVRAIAAEYIK